jgi:hypothetical protein
MAALPIANAVKEGADIKTARIAGGQSFASAKRIEKCGTSNKIKLNLPFSQKEQAKAKHPGRLLWNKEEKAWYYAGDTLPKDLEPFAPEKRRSRSNIGL